MLTPTQIKLAVAAGAVVLAFGAGWAVNGWRLHSAFDEQALWASKAAAATLEVRTAERDDLQTKLKAANDAALAKLSEAKDDTNHIRDDVRTGAVSLRIAAKCPAVRLPAPGTATSVDPGAGAELDSAAGSAYFALRDAIDKTQGKLAACQGELKLRTESVALPASAP